MRKRMNDNWKSHHQQRITIRPVRFTTAFRALLCLSILFSFQTTFASDSETGGMSLINPIKQEGRHSEPESFYKPLPTSRSATFADRDIGSRPVNSKGTRPAVRQVSNEGGPILNSPQSPVDPSVHSQHPLSEPLLPIPDVNHYSNTNIPYYTSPADTPWGNSANFSLPSPPPFLPPPPPPFPDTGLNGNPGPPDTSQALAFQQMAQLQQYQAEQFAAMQGINQNANPYDLYASNMSPNMAPNMIPNVFPNTSQNLFPNVYGGGFGQGFGNYPMTNMFGMDPQFNAGDPNFWALWRQQELLYRRRLEEDRLEAEREEAENNAEKEKPGSEWTLNRLMPVKMSSPLVETCLSGMKTMTPFNTPSAPHKGVGQPMAIDSWLDRPYYFGGFCGSMSGSQLVSNMIQQKHGSQGGLIFGFNIQDYWGIESRLHFGSLSITETKNGKQIYENWYKSIHPGTAFIPPLSSRSNELTTLDLSVHYYPLGNAKWRPFFKYGLGFARENFTDTYGKKQKIDAVVMPMGMGVKYWWNRNLALHVDLVDNIVFASGVTKTQNNVALSVGLTWAFGESRNSRKTVYWPLTPSSGSR